MVRRTVAIVIRGVVIGEPILPAVKEWIGGQCSEAERKSVWSHGVSTALGGQCSDAERKSVWSHGVSTAL